MVDAHRPAPDFDAEPAGFLVDALVGTRLHFLDWAPGRASPAAPRILLIHGLGQTAWAWTPVARRLCAGHHVVAMDLRGHGLSDSPPDGYDLDRLATDAIAVAEGAGLFGAADGTGGPGEDQPADSQPEDSAPWAGTPGIVLAGHGFGAMVAAGTAVALGDRCAALVLVDGGLEDLGETYGGDVDEFERGLAEPPEVMRSMDAFLADRAAFDPPSWDADQDRAARSTVVEVPAGHLVRSIRPQAFRACLATMLAYRPVEALGHVECRVLALLAGEGEATTSGNLAVNEIRAARHLAGLAPMDVVILPGAGHNLMRYRPDQVAAALAAAPSPR